MVKNHLKRLCAPKTWPVDRKKQKYVMRSSPGARQLGTGLPLGVVLRDMLGVAKTMKEARFMLYEGRVKVNGALKKSVDLPVGVLDVIEVPKKHYRGILTKSGKLQFIEVDKKQGVLFPKKIVNKKLIRGGKVQVSCDDGHNLVLDENAYAIGDTLVFGGEKVGHLSFKKGAAIFLAGGSHIGEVGILQDVLDQRISFKASDGTIYETLRKFVVIIGKEKPEIAVQ